MMNEKNVMVKYRINQWLQENYPKYSIRLFMNWTVNEYTEDEIFELFTTYFNDKSDSIEFEYDQNIFIISNDSGFLKMSVYAGNNRED